MQFVGAAGSPPEPTGPIASLGMTLACDSNRLRSSNFFFTAPLPKAYSAVLTYALLPL